MKRPERDDLMNELKIGWVGSVHMTLKFLLQHFLYRSSKQYKCNIIYRILRYKIVSKSTQSYKL